MPLFHRVSDTSEQEADPLGSEFSRADKRKQGRRPSESQAGDGKNEGGVGSGLRAPRQNGVAPHAKSLLSRLKADRTVFLAAQMAD